MKKKLMRAISVLLLLALSLTMFTGCSPRNETVFTVNGEDVTIADVMIHLFFQKYELFTEQVSEGNLAIADLYQLSADMLATEVGESLTLADYLRVSSVNSAMSAELCRQLALENKLQITDSDKATLKASKESMIASLGGAAAFNEFLDKTGTTDNAYDRYMENYLYMGKLSALFGDGQKYAMTTEERAAVQADYQNEYITVRQMIFYSINPSTASALSADEIAKNKERAEAALARIRNGESFDVVKMDADNPSEEAMTITQGQTVAPFNDAAFALKVGEISGIVESQYGFHIIIRDELKDDAYSSYYAARISANFQAFVNERSDEAKVNIDQDVYDAMTIR